MNIEIVGGIGVMKSLERVQVRNARSADARNLLLAPLLVLDRDKLQFGQNSYRRGGYMHVKNSCDERERHRR